MLPAKARQAVEWVETVRVALGRVLAAQRLEEGLADHLAALVGVGRVPREVPRPAPEVFVALVATTAQAVASPAQQAARVAIRALLLLWAVRVQASAGTQRPSKMLRFAMLLRP